MNLTKETIATVPFKDLVYRAALDWFMCSDPWPADKNAHMVVEVWLDQEARDRGFEDWVDAYHQFLSKKETP